MIALIGLAWADPVALRLPVQGLGVAVAVSTRQVSLAAWPTVDTGFSLSVTRGSVAALIGQRHRFVGAPGRWSLVGGAAIGPAWLYVDGQLGVTTSSHLSVEKTWTHAVFQVDVAVPLSVALTGGPDIAAPLLLEIGGGWAGSRGPVTLLGLKVGVGTTLAPSLPNSIDGHVALVAQFGRMKAPAER